jgi:hypothetical protein
MSKRSQFQKEYRAALADRVADYGNKLELIDLDQWQHTTAYRRSSSTEKIIAVWMSRKFLVQVYDESVKQLGLLRLSITRTEIGKNRQFADGITWDELQAIKDGCGYVDRLAVEIYPEQLNQINVVNMRHLWVLPDRLNFAWVLPDV